MLFTVNSVYPIYGYRLKFFSFYGYRLNFGPFYAYGLSPLRPSYRDEWTLNDRDLSKKRETKFENYAFVRHPQNSSIMPKIMFEK